MLSTLLALALSVNTALAAPGLSKVTTFDDAVVLEMKWRDRKRRRHDATVMLPKGAVEQARATPTRAPLKQAAMAAAEDVEARFADHPTVQIDARVKNNGQLVYSAKGPDMATIRKALHDAEVLGEERLEAQLQARGYMTYPGDRVGPDHEQAIHRAAPLLKDLAHSIGDPRGDRRAYTNQVLAFVQSIPYEDSRRGQDTWRPPLAVLAGNTGDCDSKVTLFLAILRAAYPKMDMAVVHVPGHALAAVDLEPGENDATVGKGDKQLVLVEPVGPQLARVGYVDKKSARGLRSKKRSVRAVGLPQRVRLVDASPDTVLLTME
jgi:hypothetical protein